VVDTLGYWDPVTVGADAEFYYRILTIYGGGAIKEVLPGVPLAFGRQHPHSLTQRSETHARSLYYGLRREYQESFASWHRDIGRASFSPLSAKPPSRPFPAPEAMLRQAPANELKRLLVADFSPDSPHAAKVEACLRQLSDLAGQLAVFHLADVNRPALGRVSTAVRTLLRERGVLTVLPGQTVRCSRLFLWAHSGLALPLDDVPSVEVLDQAWLFTEQSEPREIPVLPVWISCAGRVQSRVCGLPKSPLGWRVLDSGLFDSDWYLQRYPDLADKGVDGLWHFLAHGMHEDRDPGPGFSSSGYRARHLASDADLRKGTGTAPATSALINYLKRVGEKGVEPLPTFAGVLTRRSNAPTVMVCAHLAGPQLFGAEISILDVLDGLNQLGMNVLVSLPGVHHLDYFAEIRQRVTAIVVLPYGWWKQGVAPCAATLKHFERLMRAHEVGLVYLNTLVHDAPLLAARSLQLPVVVHVREVPESDPALCHVLGASAEQIRQRLLAHADSLIANSQRVRRYLLGDDDDTVKLPIPVVPNIVHCSRFDLPFPTQNGGFNVAMISSNEAKKGVADFVELAWQLAKLSPRIRCVLVGPETPAIATLRAQQREGVVSGNLVFSGYVSTPQLALAEAHVVVSLSSVEESFGRTVLEAMAARRPVVCYNRGALSELVVEGKTGFLVAPGDVTMAAARVQVLFQDPQLWRRMGEAARTHAARNFDAAALHAALGSALARFW
jgi:glycosyltransferase involved in cell wall biosynthesis